MVASSFQEQFLDALLRSDKQQTTRPQTERFKVGDIAQIYIKQRGRIVDKPVRQMTGAGTTAMADRVNDPKYYYPPACPVVELSNYSDMPSYYAHFIGIIEISEVYDIHPCDMNIDELTEWALDDGFDDLTDADVWFTKQHDNEWDRRWWTVIRWNGWKEVYFLPENGDNQQ